MAIWKRVSGIYVGGRFRRTDPLKPLFPYRMSIFRALGLGVFLLVLSIAMPKVARSLESAVVAFLQATQTVFEKAETLTASPSRLPVPSVAF